MEKRGLTLDAILKSPDFRESSIDGIQWLPDGSAFTFQKGEDIYRHSVEDGKEEEIVKCSNLKWEGKSIEVTDYHTTGEQNHLLIAGEQKQIWRHSFSAPYFLYDIPTSQLVPLANGNPELQNVQFSPDNKFVGFVKASNLCVATVGEANVEVKQLTSDGSDNVLNGIFDWVYEEEFGRADAFRWSRDSKKIAFWHTDQTGVQSFLLYDDTTERYPVSTTLKYPKAGEKNSVVKIGVADISSGQIVWMDIGEEDIYIPRIDWTTKPNILAIQRLNRKQNKLELLFADVNDGSVKTVLTDVSTTGWVEVTDDFIFFEKSDQFLWTSEKSGYRHIYLSDYSGNEKQITSSDWEVSSIVGFHEDSGWIYFYGKKDGAENQFLYRVKLDGSELSSLVSKPGWYTVTFSHDYSRGVLEFNSAKSPKQTYLIKSDGTKVRCLLENNPPGFAKYNLSFPEFGTLRTSDNGTELTYYITKPHDFNETKQYPVLMYGYSGPAHQVATNNWIKVRHLWHSMVASMGCIIFCVDGRGMSGKGRDFKHSAYRDISKWIVHDQIEGVKYLRSLPYVDPNRVSFWGWSGGGYLCCHLLGRAHEYIQTGIAIASATDWSLYDTIWTERYMDLLADNVDGYKAANALTYAKNVKGNLLLIHGTGDDNVHCQNTMKFAEALVQANVQFDMMLYPNRNHGIYGGNTTYHLFTKLTNFLKQHLKLQ